MKVLLLILLIASPVLSSSVSRVIQTKDSAVYTDFAAWVTAKGSTSVSPIFSGQVFSVNGKVTVPATIDIAGFVNGAKFTGAVGPSHDTLVINKMSAYPMYKVFENLVVSIASGAVQSVDSVWFGYPARQVNFKYAVKATSSVTADSVCTRAQYQSGKLGIGGTSSMKLTVAATSQYDGITINNGTYSIVNISGTGASNDTGAIEFKGANTVGTRIAARGTNYIRDKLAVGSTTIDSTLRVAGSGRFTGNIAVDGLARVTGGVVGTVTGYANTGNSDNVGNGYLALSKIRTGASNTATGYQALSNDSTGSFNTSTGAYSLNINGIGKYNTADGYLALGENVSGDSCTAIGYGSSNYNSTGNGNTAIGLKALISNTTGSNNVAIGKRAGPSITNASNTTCIGAGATATASNQFVVQLTQIPNSATGLPSGAIYRDGSNFLKIVP
jgi:hypothetical protein